jgi:hypothetical protein
VEVVIAVFREEFGRAGPRGISTSQRAGMTNGAEFTRKRKAPGASL